MGERCTCKPVVLHAVECATISPHGICEFCKEPKRKDGSCSGCWDEPVLMDSPDDSAAYQDPHDWKSVEVKIVTEEPS